MAQFWKITPGGNPTLLLRAEDVAVERRVETAQRILSPLHLGGEQAGYVRLRPQGKGEKPRLDMMGGEFCLNATRAFGALLAWQGLLPLDGEGMFRGDVEVSGAAETVLVEVELSAKGPCYAWASLEFAELPKVEKMEGVALVRLPGICHLVLRDQNVPNSGVIEDACAQLREKFELKEEEATGCMWLNDGDNGPELYPAVWVRDIASLCLESACGSGTLASALVLADEEGKRDFAIRQPSGDALTVEIREQGTGFSVRVGGPVRLVAQGEVMIED